MRICSMSHATTVHVVDAVILVVVVQQMNTIPTTHSGWSPYHHTPQVSFGCCNPSATIRKMDSGVRPVAASVDVVAPSEELTKVKDRLDSVYSPQYYRRQTHTQTNTQTNTQIILVSPCPQCSFHYLEELWFRYSPQQENRTCIPSDIQNQTTTRKYADGSSIAPSPDTCMYLPHLSKYPHHSKPLHLMS